VLYLRGSVNFFETYSGMYVPRPLEFVLARTGATVTQIATELNSLPGVAPIQPDRPRVESCG
jgi:hypothetical protein